MFVRSVLLIALVAGCAAQLKCPEPQKGVYMSYNAISKQDTLPLMFTEINTLIPRFNDTYNNTQNSTLYKIINLHPQLYYSEHHQKETYVGNCLPLRRLAACQRYLGSHRTCIQLQLRHQKEQRR